MTDLSEVFAQETSETDIHEFFDGDILVSLRCVAQRADGVGWWTVEFGNPRRQLTVHTTKMTRQVMSQIDKGILR